MMRKKKTQQEYFEIPDGPEFLFSREKRLQQQKIYNSLRPEIHKFYHTKEWKKVSEDYRKAHPYCAMCAAEGKQTPADLVDHIVEISDGGEKLDWSNLQSLCSACHNKKTAREVWLRFQRLTLDAAGKDFGIDGLTDFVKQVEHQGVEIPSKTSLKKNCEGNLDLMKDILAKMGFEVGDDA